jgi:DTW domain-containing protein YfiP
MQQQREDPVLLFEQLYDRVYNRTYVERIKQLRFGLSKFTSEQILYQDLPTFRNEEFIQKLDSETENKYKQDWSTQRYVATQFANLMRQDNKLLEYCPTCWVSINKCMCTMFKPVSAGSMTQPSPLVNNKPLRTKILVNMHTKEFFRSSNTAKVMATCIQDTEFFLSGLTMHEEELEREYWQKALTGEKQVAVLFPSENSLTFSEYFEQQNQKLTEQNGVNKQVSEFTLIVLDGTWSNARNLNRRVPDHVPRIRISPPNDYVGIFSSLRQQTSQQRISTLEATMMALRDIYCNNSEMNRNIDIIIENLKIMINHIKKLIGHKVDDFTPKRDPNKPKQHGTIRKTIDRDKK